MRIGVLTGGGDCPGLNAVIRAIVRAGEVGHGDGVWGFLDSWDGVMDQRFVRLDVASVRGLLPRGGTVIGTRRARAEEEGAMKWALDIIALFGNRLTPRIGQIVSGLSYANRRRVEIARALASRPRILLLDEPTAGMNPAETLELAEQIKSLHELGLTILLIEHKLDVVTRLASNVIVLDHGEKIAEGPADEVRRNEEVLRAYLGRAATEQVAKEKANA